MALIIENKDPAGFTAVPNAFLDEYMPEAAGEFIKVYLYLIRAASHPSPGVDINDLADRLHYTEKDVVRALRYWEKQGILSLAAEDGDIVSVSLLPVRAEGEVSAFSGDSSALSGKAEVSAQAEETGHAEEDVLSDAEKEAPQKTVPGGIRAISVDELASLQGNGDFAEVVYVAEMYLKRTLSSKDVQLFAYLYKDLGFSSELIEYLIEYCVNGGHTSYRYMEAVALGWHDEGIKNAEEARESHQEYGTESRRVMQAFGITGRTLTLKEKQFIRRWRREMGMPLDVITEAINATMTATHSQSFEYADTILADWNKKGIKNVEKAKEAQLSRRMSRSREKAAEKAENKPRFVNFDQRKADLTALLKDGNW